MTPGGKIPSWPHGPLKCWKQHEILRSKTQLDYVLMDFLSLKQRKVCLLSAFYLYLDM